MDTVTAYRLNAATTEFYREQAASFSATRKGAWPGWARVLEVAVVGGLRLDLGPSVLDVGCGNLRFERFLMRERPDAAWRFTAVDNCVPLVGEPPANVKYREADVMDALLRGRIEESLGCEAHQLVACFGFMHHVPGHENRVRLLQALAERTAPGGFLAVSFWQFLQSPELARRAAEAHHRGLAMLGAAGLDVAQLEPGDYLLGWQDAESVFRYCHAFDEAEVNALLDEANLANRLVDRFESDGRTKNLNGYLVLRG